MGTIARYVRLTGAAAALCSLACASLALAQSRPAPSDAAGSAPLNAQGSSVVAPVKRVTPSTPPLPAAIAKSAKGDKAAKNAKKSNAAKTASKAAPSQPILPKSGAAMRCGIDRNYDPAKKKCTGPAAAPAPAAKK